MIEAPLGIGGGQRSSEDVSSEGSFEFVVFSSVAEAMFGTLE